MNNVESQIGLMNPWDKGTWTS